MAEKAQYSKSKVPLFINRTQPFLVHAWSVRGVIFKKNPSMEADIQPKKHTALQGKCPYLLTDRNETFNVRSACVGNAKYEFSGKYLKWKPRYTRKSRLLSKLHHVIIMCYKFSELVD